MGLINILNIFMKKLERSSTIVVVQTFNVSLEQLWNAISQKDQMVQWFFANIPDFKAEVGFTTEFLVVNEGRHFTHLWEIIEAVPNQRIVYRWKYKEYPGEGIVSFDISGGAERSSLTLTNLGSETFPRDIPEFARESCQGGWNYFIKERLATYLS